MNEQEFKRLYQGEFKPLVKSQEQLEILKHARKVEFFCGGSKDMDALVESGLMEYAGRRPFVPDPYYKLTAKGKKYLDAKIGRCDSEGHAV